jgi:Fe-S-cluster-containing dehydrogenase component
VTVREKGVMEKCTFCVQRIRDAQNIARLQDRGCDGWRDRARLCADVPGQRDRVRQHQGSELAGARVAASGRGYRVLEG